jgi:protein-S-isoprenylcysteine O-methyltransferase Ste14
MMKNLLKSIGLVLALLGVIGILIGLPAIKFGVFTQWQIILLAASYLSFFLGTVWRVIRYGDLVDRSEDRQVKNTGGRVASLVTIVGLVGVHWLAIYTFATQDRVADLVTDRYIIQMDRLYSIAGLMSIVAAIIVSQVAIKTLGKFFDRLTIKSDHRLVTEGIYRYVRHPIYTSYILLFFGFCLILQSLWGLGLLVAVCAVWFGNRIGIEEQMLAGEFGEEYQVYCQGTKRLFPYIY